MAFVVIVFVAAICLSCAQDSRENALNLMALHTNDIRGRFTSEDDMIRHLEVHIDAIMRDDSMYFTKQHPFIVSVRDSPGLEAIRRKYNIDESRCNLFYDNHFEIYMTPAEMKTFADTHAADLIGVVAVTAPMKISTGVQHTFAKCEEEKDGLLVNLAPLSQEEINAFFKWLDGVSASPGYEFSYKTESIVPHNKFPIVVTPTNCKDYIKVTELIASQPEVHLIDPHGKVYHANYWAKGVMDSGSYTDVAIFTTAGLTGKNVVIGVSDTGLDLNSNYFYDTVSITANSPTASPHRKVASYAYVSGKGDFTDISQGHGSHVCGTAAGKSYEGYGDFKRFDGVASDAKIAFFDISINDTDKLSPPTDYTTLFQNQYGYGARIFSQSWGSFSDSSSQYDLHALQCDTFMWNHKDTLILFAAGNYGDTFGAGSIISPSAFKNGLTVGAGLSESQAWTSYSYGTADSRLGISSLAFFSSRGPTFDGRIKPDIIGPGYPVISVNALPSSYNAYHTGLLAKSGTSMATPGVAGMAAVIRQYFVDGFYPTGVKTLADSFTPSGALLKAIIIASGKPLSYTYKGSALVPIGAYPSSIQGYGRVQLNSVLHFGAAVLTPLTLYVIGDISSLNTTLYKQFTTTGEPAHTYTFDVSVATEVRVVLCYTDTPGSSSNTNPVQNRISVSVSDGTSSFTPLDTVLNTYYVIDVSAAASTTYTVTVTPTLITVTQPYALVIVGNIKPLTAVSAEEALISSQLAIEDIPYVNAIIAMSVISFFLVATTVGVAAAEYMADKKIFFEMHRW